MDERVWGELYVTRYVGQPAFGDRSVDYVDVLVALLGWAISRALRESELSEDPPELNRDTGLLRTGHSAGNRDLRQTKFSS